MKAPRGLRVLVVLIAVSAAACTWVWARSSASVPLAPTGQPGNVFDPGAVGLSMEASELETGHLSAAHDRLVRLMRLLGPSVLRIGGNSVDFSWWTSTGEPPPPWAISTVTPADLAVLHGLLAAAGWRVLLGVDLGHFEPARAADEARYAQRILGKDLVGVELGNEPNDFGHSGNSLRSPIYAVDEYLREAEAYRQALNIVAPGVALYGPALGQHTTWLTQVGVAARMFRELTQHYYPTGTCPSVPASAPPTAAELLSPVVRLREDEALDVLELAGRVSGRSPRIGETGSITCSESPSVGTVFATALWALDWSLRAVSTGVSGLNFHGGLGVAGCYSGAPICAPNEAAAYAGDVIAQPEYYGLLAARQLEGGRFVPTHLVTPSRLPNLTTWATLAPDGTVRIAIDNLATEALAQPVSIAISGYAATYETLVGPSVEATTGITLGNTRVTSVGQWRPRPVRLPRVLPHSFRVVVHPASAIIVTLRRKGLHA